MTWAEVLEKALAALIGVAAVAVPALAVQLARYLASLAKVKLTEAQQKQIEFAAQKGVAFAHEKLRDAVGQGDVKATVALQQAKSLAPEAFGKLDEITQAAVIQATYATMKASLPHPSTYVVGESGAPPPERIDTRATAIPPYRGPRP